MSRKATFSPKRPKANSSAHNSRQEIPDYLLETSPNFDGNFYERIPPYKSDVQFIELAKKIYNQKFIERTGQNQKMQKKQADALLWEVAISTEDHHTKDDASALFKMLKNEKLEENKVKSGLIATRLKPMPIKPVYVLPTKLRIKRKPKKENFNETGYHILELSGHADEGHFVRKGKWENLSYYPARDILLKDDGNWYIKSKELDEDKSEETFDLLADMAEFEKVYNNHWHVKYTNFNINTGLSAQFSKGEVSGKGRLKKVADFLGLKYVPEEKVPFAQGVKTIKEQHHVERQNKYKQLMMKFGNEIDMKISQEKVLKREEVIAKKTTNARLFKKSAQKFEEGLQESERVVRVQQDQIESLEKNHDELKSENNTLATRIEDKEKQITSDAKTLKDSQEKIEVLEKKVQELENLTEPTGYEIEGEYVSEELYDYVEKQRRTLNYKSSRVDSLEEKLVFQKERVVARDKLMNDQDKRHDKVEIEVLKGMVYSDKEYPIEFDEDDKPIKFEKETWKRKAEYVEEEVGNLILENEWQAEKISELENLAYYDEQIWNPEIGDFSYVTTSYKDENEILAKELAEAKKIIEIIRDYDVPISQLSDFWDEIKVTVLDTTWEKRVESVENEIQQDDIKIKPRKENLEDKISFPSFKR